MSTDAINSEMGNYKNKVEELIGKLKGNPMFHMSLGSRELFHSNFLGWLGENYPKIFIGVLLGLELDEGSGVNVYREKRNIDLLVEFSMSGSPHLLAVEVKVKDILRPTQLEGYNQEIEVICAERKIPPENVHKIALTLADPLDQPWIDCASEGCANCQGAVESKSGEWNRVAFSQVSERLGEALSDNESDIFKSEDLEVNLIFIERYRSFIKNLSDLTESVETWAKESLETGSGRIDSFTFRMTPCDDVNKKLESFLRLHSTFGKLRAAKLSGYLVNQVRANCSELKALTLHDGVARGCKCKDGDIFISAGGGFQRGAFATLSVKRVVGSGTLSLGFFMRERGGRVVASRMISHPNLHFRKSGVRIESAEGRKENNKIRACEMIGIIKRTDSWEWIRNNRVLNGYSNNDNKYIYERYSDEFDSGGMSVVDMACGLRDALKLMRCKEYVKRFENPKSNPS